MSSQTLPQIDVDAVEAWLVAEAATGREYKRTSGPMQSYLRESLGLAKSFTRLSYYQMSGTTDTVPFPEAIVRLERFVAAPFFHPEQTPRTISASLCLERLRHYRASVAAGR